MYSIEQGIHQHTNYHGSPGTEIRVYYHGTLVVNYPLKNYPRVLGPTAVHVERALPLRLWRKDPTFRIRSYDTQSIRYDTRYGENPPRYMGKRGLDPAYTRIVYEREILRDPKLVDV